MDAEGLVLGDGRVVTQDTLVEGVHFRRDWITWRDLGYKAVAVNLSDLAALGGQPEALLVALAVPSETESGDVVELYEGLNEPGIPVLGGDTSRAERVTITITAIGRSDRVPGRSGARPGDVLVVTGPIGAAAAGLHVLAHGLEGFDDLVERHRRPPIRLAEGRKLAQVAHAMIDLSDGIGADAARIAERSGCRLVIDVDDLPVASRAGEVDDLPFWTMGEDYELLAALTPDDAQSSGFFAVGRCEEGSGVEPADLGGWDSFRR